MRIPARALTRALTRTLALAALLAMLPAAGFAADEASPPQAGIAVEATNSSPDPISTPAPALPPAGLDSAISTSSTYGDCLINCGVFVGEWVYNVTYVQCCGQTHTCSDGSTGYGWVFYPYGGMGHRCAI